MALPASPVIPVAYFTASSVISWIALNNSQGNRIYYLPFILATAVLSFRHLNDFSSWYGLDSLWGMFMIIYVAHITSVLYVEKWRLHSEGLDDDDDNYDGTSRQARWDFKAAYKIWNNPRWLKTTNEAPGVSKPYEQQQQQQKQMTIFRFVLICIAKLVIFWIATFLFALNIFPGYFQPLSLDDFAADKEIYLRRLLYSAEGVSLRETFLRSALAIQWIFLACILLESCHHILALFFVAVLRLDKPDEWPPFFGSPLEAYSIRRFWGKFWNRAIYRPYTSYASILSRRVLRLTSNSRWDKLCISFTIFLISGVAHSIVSWQMGHRCGVWRDVGWFIANFLAAAFELALQNHPLFLPVVEGCRLSTTTVQQSSRFRNWSLKILGFIWVFAFFFWSVPKWQYAKVYCILIDRLQGEGGGGGWRGETVDR